MMGSGFILQIRVTPGAKKNEIIRVDDNKVVHMKIKAPPVEGKANQEVLNYLHELFSIRISQMELLRGDKSREKQICVNGISVDDANTILYDHISKRAN
jgi:uncharacterized protein (TIGR00251 family)